MIGDKRSTRQRTFVIELDEETYTRLHEEAARRGVSTDQIVHEAVEEMYRQLALGSRDRLTAEIDGDRIVIKADAALPGDEPSN